MTEGSVLTQQPLAEGTSAGGLKSQVQVRDLVPFIVDEPERLGEDAGVDVTTNWHKE